MASYTVVRIYNKLIGLNYITYFQGKLNRKDAFEKVMFNCFKNSSHKFLHEVAKIQGCFYEWEVFTDYCDSKEMAMKIRETKKELNNCNYPNGLNNYRNNGQTELDDIEDFKNAIDMAKKNKFDYWQKIKLKDIDKPIKRTKKQKTNKVNDHYQIIVLEEKETNKCFSFKVPMKSINKINDKSIMNRFKNRVELSKINSIIPDIFPYENFTIIYNEVFIGNPKESSYKLNEISAEFNCEFPFGFNLPTANKLSEEDILEGIIEVNSSIDKVDKTNNDSSSTIEEKQMDSTIWDKIKNLFK